MPEVRFGDETLFFNDFPRGGENHNIPKLPHNTGEKVFIGLFTLIFVIMICGCFLNCCKRRRRVIDRGEFCNFVVYMKRRAQASSNVGYVISEGAAPVVVTSATHTAPGGYPVTQMPATTYQPNVYGTPYPAQTTGNVSMQMPMPMPGVQPPMPGTQPHMVAYPPMAQPGAGVANMNPPTYDMAMANAGPSVMPGSYEKQMPYNPNYAQQ